MSNLLRRLEKVEEVMSPHEPQKFRIEVAFVRPDRTISGRLIIESGKPDREEKYDEDEAD